MRKLKFRVWDTIIRRWLNVLNVMLSKDGDVIAVRELGGEIYGLHQVVLMQFTGLLDKNGKEIWEGDIVRESWRTTDGEWKDGGASEVRWGKYSDDEYVNGIECWIYGKRDPLSECGTPATYGHGERVVEVIGNIYEQPEPLKSGAGR